MEKSLFIIPCCSGKATGGDYPIWAYARGMRGANAFPLLDNDRERLISFYSKLQKEDAGNYYKKMNSRNPEDVWNKNLTIPDSPTMRAIDRYQGRMYSMFDSNLISKMRTGEMNNVLIVSALMGFIKPTDLIPDYNLMMGDKTPDGERVSKYWSRVFANRDVILEVADYLEQYDYIFIAMSHSTGYLDSVNNLLSDYPSYLIKSHSGSNNPQIWGRIVNESLQSSRQDPETVGNITNNHNSELIKLKDYKSSGGTSSRGRDQRLRSVSVKSEVTNKVSTDCIRKYVIENVIEPARERGLNEITIRAGDVHSALGLKSRMPMVCSALRSKIEEIANVKITEIDAPPSGQGANFYVTYKLLVNEE